MMNYVFFSVTKVSDTFEIPDALKLVFLFLFIAFSSCKSPYKSFELQDNAPAKTDFPSLFQNADKSFLFKSSIQYKDFHFGGLAVIQKEENEAFRLAFTTKTGAKVLDVTLNETQMKVHHALNLLRRKPILKLLENDLRLILDNVKVTDSETLKSPNFEGQIFRLKHKNAFRYYFFDKNEILTKVEKGSKTKPKVALHFDDYENDFPETITFEHQNLNLKIEMSLFQNSSKR